MAGATGLSIYFPPADYFSQDYTLVETAGEWNTFLASYYGLGQSIPTEQQPTFTNADGIAATFFDEAGLNILGSHEPAAAAPRARPDSRSLGQAGVRHCIYLGGRQ